MYTDQRTHVAGPPRSVRLARVGTPGSGAVSKAHEDSISGGNRVVVAGRESLRIIRSSDPSSSPPLASSRSATADSSSVRNSTLFTGSGPGIGPSHKSVTSRSGCRLDISRNLWDGSGLKVDSALTDVGWAYGAFSNKILTSARNGELIMWDINKSSGGGGGSGGSKIERRVKDHIRSIHKLSISSIVHYYCVTGGADGDVRVWDLRDLSRSLMKIHHTSSVRSVVFSTSLSTPLQIGVGLDNGSIYRWDLQKGPLRHMDRLPVAHSGPILTLDWSNAAASTKSRGQEGIADHDSSLGVVTGSGGGSASTSGGWIVSGGLDRTVKVWDASISHIPHKPTYTLHPSFPVRRVLWRPDYECELAVVSNDEFGSGSGSGGELTAGAGTSPVIGSKGDANFGDGRGDAIEIWDVRKGWIAKWAISGSAVEGGVSDIVFADSHTLWAQHSSGMFSQFDLRQSYKPIDAIPRTSITWEAGGGLAFVSGKKNRWDNPYDDIHPDQRQNLDTRQHKSKLKRLGDPPTLPASQDFGTYVRDSSTRDMEALIRLARGYVFEGTDRRAICTRNAQTAYEAGKHQAAQAWLLMGSLLTDIIPPPTPPASPPPPPHTGIPGIPHSVSAPAATLNISSVTQPIAEPSGRSLSAEPVLKNGDHKNSSPSRPNSLHVTPSSSNPTSPHRVPIVLPPITPAPHRTSISPRNRRGSTAAVDQVPRRMSSYSHSRPSMSSTQSESPSDSTKSHHSHRHVGEGALDDSDSSDSGDAREENKADDGGSSEEESEMRPLSTRVVPTVPSPLSHIAGQQQWTEDEEDGDDNDASPSPGSTDTESSYSGSSVQQNKSKTSPSRRNSHPKSRSRSSTVASLAVSSLHPGKPLVHQPSHSSIRTVIAGDASVGEPDSREETIMDLSGSKKAFSPESRRTQRSLAVSSDLASNAPDEVDEVKVQESPERTGKISEKRKLRIMNEEAKFREMGWDTLRTALGRFADEGDVQMCSMLSVVAPLELRVDKWRIARYLESYIDILTHLQLHSPAAYVRKFSMVEDVQDITRLETTVYTSCGRCRKSIMIRSAPLKLGNTKGQFSYCSSCQQSVLCSICHLTVRTLLFQCSVCTHGGHQECYRRYYMERPMVEVAIPLAPSHESRGRSATSPFLSGYEPDDDSTIADDNVLDPTGTATISQMHKFSGHPCAAGCGHFCWAATGISGGNDS